MSVKKLQDDIETILDVIKKGDADPQTKLRAVHKLAETLRNDIQDFADEHYANYLQEEADDGFDAEAAFEQLELRLATQQPNYLLSFYGPDTFESVEEPRVRVVLARVLTKIIIDAGREPRTLWTNIINSAGVLEDEQ